MLWAFLQKTPWNLALKGKLFHEGPGVGRPPEVEPSLQSPRPWHIGETSEALWGPEDRKMLRLLPSGNS